MFCTYTPSISLFTSSASLPSTPDFPLPAAFISSLSLVSFVPLNAAFSIKPRIATQQIASASTTSNDLFVDANFASHRALPFFESLCSKILLLIPSPFLFPSLRCPFQSKFPWFIHIKLCENSYMVFEQKTQVCHHIKAHRICTYIWSWNRKQTQRAEYISDGVHARGVVCRVSAGLGGFSHGSQRRSSL